MAKTKQLSFGSVLLLGINGVIGSGIFLLPSTLFAHAGWGSLLAILLAGAGTALIALNYAALAARIDGDGGAWLYAEQAFGDVAGFGTGWLAWFLGIITIAAEVAAFLTTLGGLLPAVRTPWVHNVLAVGIIAILGIINLFGPRLLQFADNLASGFKITVLLLFIGVGAWAILRGGAPTAVTLKLPAGGGLMLAFTTAFYMFTGFSFLPTAAHDMRNPSKVLPRALLIIMAGVTAVYLFVQTVTIMTLGEHVVGASLPVATAFGQLIGSVGRALMLSGMLVSILGVALAVSFAAPVGAAALATDKQLLPAVIGRTNKDGAPVVAITVTTVAAALLILSGGYLFLVALIVLVSFLQYVGTALATIKLLPQETHWLRRWGIPLATLLLLAVVMVRLPFEHYLMTTAVLAVGYAVYWLDLRAHRT